MIWRVEKGDVLVLDPLLHTLPTPPTYDLILNYIYPEYNPSIPTPNLPNLHCLPYPIYPYIITGFSSISILDISRPYTPNITHRVFIYSEIQSFGNPLKFPVFSKVQTFDLHIDLDL